MKLTDRELWRAANLQDFRFRLGFEENSHERNEREHADELYKGASFQTKITAALVLPDTLRTWGTDHSRWDGNVNFKPMRTMAARFTFIKAMEGTVATTYYIENTLRAKDEGLAVAPYHWLHANNRVNCKTQAQKFWERVWTHVGKLPPMIDFEWTYWNGAAAYPTYADLDIFVTEFTRVSGIKPLWYSAAGYMNLFGKMPVLLRAKFAGFVVANYGVLFPNMPMGFTQDDWDFWQFAATGDAERITPNDVGKKEVDLIYAKLTHVSFDQKYGLTEEPPPTGEPMPETIKEGTVSRLKLGSSTVLQIRSGAGLSFSDIGDLHAGDKVYGKIVSAVWLEFNKIIRASGASENKYGFASTQFMDVRDVPVEPPTTPPAGLPEMDIHISADMVTVSGPSIQTVSVELRPK